MKDAERALAAVNAQIAYIEHEINKAMPYVDLLREKRRTLVIHRRALEENVGFLKKSDSIVSIGEYTKISRELRLAGLEINRVEHELTVLHAAINAQQKKIEGLKSHRDELVSKIEPRGVVLDFRRKKLD
jgi:chromosome segregation ATPase